MTTTHRRVGTKQLLAAVVGLGALAVGFGGAPATAAPAAATGAVAPTAATADDDEPYKVLIVGKTLGFRHSHIDETTNAVIAMGEESGFTVDVWDPPNSSGGWWGPGSPGQPGLSLETTPFSSTENLKQYATIIFDSPVDNTNSLDPSLPRLLDNRELNAFKGYIQSGGGYVGLHAATDTMHTVPWYSKLSGGGARFVNHPAQQTATMRVEDPTHPSTMHLPMAWERFDEWYNFSTNPRGSVRVLLTLDESTYSGGTMGEDHPISWCQNFMGGRSWYEGAGHVEASYEDPAFLEHLKGGIEWTAGKVSGGGDCVTFSEVRKIVASAGDGSTTSESAKAQLRKTLANAEKAADAGDRKAAIQALRTARAQATGIPGARVLVSKVADLIEWQTGLRDADV
ncbi:ThuA domain-containing protein [Terracoccus luteus]|uniref:Trehalose utilization protein n=1 Tax=Terracoccus luteus TaxID=53356 RepID=A0A495XYG6_9MICO|nr:ThuA domain-containing protein [Terracoccus luteus]MBB2986587.1 type 1 glutamine amidotransferase [Terracoccus luteus]MCP2171824.1 type 1 glutamine amidotransferase [Terracoccus luteus]RKT79337.1 trehalose utilization protein [Terracoccus luteus]